MNNIKDIYKYVNMYELPTVYGKDFDKSLVLPKNMYQMPKIYDNSHHEDEVNRQMSSLLVDPNVFKDIDQNLALNPLKDLLSRQQLLLNRIQVLEKGLDSLDRPSKGCPQKVNKTSQNKTLKTSSSIGCSEEVLNSIKDVVIVSDGKQLPLSVFSIIKLMKSLGLKISIKFHFHSSLGFDNNSLKTSLDQSLSSIKLNQISDDSRVKSRLDNDLILTFILKDISGIKMILSPNDIPIESEANILRFMARFAAKVRPELSYLYEGIDDISKLTAVDNFVDEINAKVFVDPNKPTKYLSELDSLLSKNRYLSGNSPSIADLLLWSGLNQRTQSPKLSSHLKKWFDSIKQLILT